MTNIFKMRWLKVVLSHLKVLNRTTNCNISDDTLISELTDYFLGTKYYISISESPRQANTAILFEIESRYKGNKDYFYKLYGSKNNYNKKALVSHILSLTDGKDYGLCDPPMENAVFVEEIAKYFLGEDIYDICCNPTLETIYNMLFTSDSYMIPQPPNWNILYQIMTMHRGNSAYRKILKKEYEMEKLK